MEGLKPHFKESTCGTAEAVPLSKTGAVPFSKTGYFRAWESPALSKPNLSWGGRWVGEGR